MGRKNKSVQSLAKSAISSSYWLFDHTPRDRIDKIKFLADKFGLQIPGADLAPFAVAVVEKVRASGHPQFLSRKLLRMSGRRTEKRAKNAASAVERNNIPQKRQTTVRGDEDKFKLFYDSWEWKRLRYDVLKERGRKCECCGTTPTDGARIVCDHVKPIRYHWHLRLERSNIQILCDDCNMGKGSRDETDWREAPRSLQ